MAEPRPTTGSTPLPPALEPEGNGTDASPEAHEEAQKVEHRLTSLEDAEARHTRRHDEHLGTLRQELIAQVEAYRGDFRERLEGVRETCAGCRIERRENEKALFTRDDELRAAMTEGFVALRGELAGLAKTVEASFGSLGWKLFGIAIGLAVALAIASVTGR